MANSGKKLKKQLGLLDVFAFGIGPMLSSGIFLLPGMVFAKVGVTSILAYMVAGLLTIPPLLSKAELSTAMPKAGGAYYFLDRSMGPLVGTIAGLGTWMSLSFKSAFDLIGLGAYLVLFVELPIKPVAVGLCVLFAGLSVSGVKNVGRFQGMFVSLLLAILAFFIVRGLPFIQPTHFEGFFEGGPGSFLGAVGFVYVSFAGLTKIASVAEEVEDLERNIPLGMMLALVVTLVIYGLGMVVMVGTVPGDQLAHSLTPVVDAAVIFMGPLGKIVMTAAAILAFVASANAGITASSRYPLAMSRDNLVPPYWKKIGRFYTPTRSIMLTMGLMVLFILLLSPEGIAKLGSAFKLLIFGMLNLAVIVMRESKINSYDPSYQTKLYPWVQIIGLITPIVLIPELGLLPVFLSAAVIVSGALWYYFYAEKRVQRSAAMYQVFQRFGSAATPQLDRELRQLMREKGLRREDQFEHIILRAPILHHEKEESQNDILRQAAREFADRTNVTAQQVYRALLHTTQTGDTPISAHIALPHARLEGVDDTELIIVHSKTGIDIEGADEPIYVVFILISPKDKPRQHLRFLAELANRAEDIDFASDWRELEQDSEIRNMFLRTGDVAEIVVESENLVDKQLSEISLHDDCLIAMITRKGEMIVPHGHTRLEMGDHLTIIGREEAVDQMVKHFDKLQKN